MLTGVISYNYYDGNPAVTAISGIVALAGLAGSIWVLVMAIKAPEPQFQAAGQNRTLWIVLSIVGILCTCCCGLFGIVISVIFLASVRPKLQQVGGGFMTGGYGAPGYGPPPGYSPPGYPPPAGGYPPAGYPPASGGYGPPPAPGGFTSPPPPGYPPSGPLPPNGGWDPSDAPPPPSWPPPPDDGWPPPPTPPS